MTGVVLKFFLLKNWLKNYSKDKGFQNFIPGMNFLVISRNRKLLLETIITLLVRENQ